MQAQKQKAGANAFSTTFGEPLFVNSSEITAKYGPGDDYEYNKGGKPTFSLTILDPINRTDAGAGPWNSQPKEPEIERAYRLLRDPGVLNLLALKYGPDAARHLWHYFHGNGQTNTIDLMRMLKEGKSNFDAYLSLLTPMQGFLESIPDGTHSFAMTGQMIKYNSRKESQNWFLAIGGYRSWIKGIAIVTRENLVANYTYKFFDRYNWDVKEKKKTPFKEGNYFGGGLFLPKGAEKIKDEWMAKFHLQGYAKEYDNVGSFDAVLKWKRGDAKI